MTKANELIHGFGSTETSVGNYDGLTKREHFASLFLQGLLSKYSLQKPEDQDIVSKVAIELADTFITQLNK